MLKARPLARPTPQAVLGPHSVAKASRLRRRPNLKLSFFSVASIT